MLSEGKRAALAGEIEALRGADGIIRARKVVDWARDHPASALHASLEWDDAKAGDLLRLVQARRLIALSVVSRGGERRTVVLRIDRSIGGGYRAMDEVKQDPTLRERLLSDAIKEFLQLRRKYGFFDDELGEVFAAIDAVAATVDEASAAA